MAAIQDIKSYVSEENSKGEVKLRITEVESRFTKKVPISDVTLKIAINEEIVAELQLTLQTNFASYNFAHKVYELARSKVFSKIKITHNYFEEFRKDFVDMVQRSIETGGSSQVKQSFLKKLFSLEENRTKTLAEAIELVLSKDTQKRF